MGCLFAAGSYRGESFVDPGGFLHSVDDRVGGLFAEFHAVVPVAPDLPELAGTVVSAADRELLIKEVLLAVASALTAPQAGPDDPGREVADAHAS